MPIEAMLRPPVVIPNDRTAYAQELVTGLSQAHKYMSDITKELRRRQKNRGETSTFLLGGGVGRVLPLCKMPCTKVSDKNACHSG